MQQAGNKLKSDHEAEAQEERMTEQVKKLSWLRSESSGGSEGTTVPA